MAATSPVPLRYHVYVVLGIFGFVAVVAASAYGIQVILGGLWVDPICEKACQRHHAKLREVDYRGSKTKTSECICTNDVEVSCTQADTVLGIATAVPIAFFVLGASAYAIWREKRGARPAS